MSFVKEVMKKRQEYNEYIENTLKPSVIENIKGIIKEYALSTRDKHLETFIKSNYIYDGIKLSIFTENNYITYRIDPLYSYDTIHKRTEIRSKYYCACTDILDKLNKEEIINDIYNEIYDGCVFEVKKEENNKYSIKILIK
jgi:hypothetical protein